MSTQQSRTPWTPGPYEVCNGTDVFTASGATNAAGIKADHNDGWQVADCDTGVTFVDGHLTNLSLEEKQANARLFSKAPLLVEMLANVCRQYRNVRAAEGYPTEHSESILQAEALLQQIREGK